MSWLLAVGTDLRLCDGVAAWCVLGRCAVFLGPRAVWGRSPSVLPSSVVPAAALALLWCDRCRSQPPAVDSHRCFGRRAFDLSPPHRRPQIHIYRRLGLRPLCGSPRLPLCDTRIARIRIVQSLTARPTSNAAATSASVTAETAIGTTPTTNLTTMPPAYRRLRPNPLRPRGRPHLCLLLHLPPEYHLNHQRATPANTLPHE